jgi:predicted phage-related endonuclease
MVGKITNDILPSGSRIPGIMGVSPFRSPNDELAASIDALEGKPRPPFEVEAADWGNTLEPIIITEAAKRLGITIKEFQVDYALSYLEDDEIILQCSLDSILEGDGRTIKTDPDLRIYVIGANQITLNGLGCCESKLTSAMPEEEPPAYRGPLQLQAQLLCAGFTWGVIATLYRGTELRLFFYQASGNMQTKIIDVCKEFTRRVNSKSWYPAVNPADAVKAYPTVDESKPAIELAGDVGEYARRLIEIKAQAKILDEEIDQLQSKIMDTMADAEEAYIKNEDGSVAARIKWAMRSYKAQPEKVTPAKPARIERAKTLQILGVS